jgi:hypothetical protein
MDLGANGEVFCKLNNTRPNLRRRGGNLLQWANIHARMKRPIYARLAFYDPSGLL